MRILGIDPGLKITGYGLLDFNAHKIKLLEAGTIEPKPKELFQKRIHTVYRNLDEILKNHRPDVLILEKLYAHVKHPMTASIMGHVRGVICLLCAQQDIKLVEYPVKRIRQALAGNGNASKNQVRALIAHRLRIDERKLTLDTSDALALALGYVHIGLCKYDR